MCQVITECTSFKVVFADPSLTEIFSVTYMENKRYSTKLSTFRARVLMTSVLNHSKKIACSSGGRILLI